MPITTLSLAVVGADYPNRRGPGRRFEIAMCRPGDPVDLTPEPNNSADPRAVAVKSEREIVMGYISAERCGWIGRMINEGRDVRAVFQEATPYGAVVRISLDGSNPILPDRPAQSRPNDEDFWPDDPSPDW